MKKTIIAIIILVSSLLLIGTNTKETERAKVTYIQCVVIDEKVHGCTDISEFKILKTESMDGFTKHN